MINLNNRTSTDHEFHKFTDTSELRVDINNSSAFGRVSTVMNTPQVQLKYPYNINTDIIQTLINHSLSSVVASKGLATITCSGSPNSSSQLRSVDAIRYNPGQGSEFLGTCSFTPGVANSSQFIGVGDDNEGFFFGYNGSDFGISHKRNGSLEVRHLTITSGADGTGGNFIITLDGISTTITVNANDTIAEIVETVVATAIFKDSGKGWLVSTSDNIVIEFTSFISENAQGTFSFTDTNSGVTAGVFTQSATEILGVTPVEVFTKQVDWNTDKLDGNGHSGMIIDPSLLNVFKIQYQYLGAGNIEFFVENTSSGRLIPVHNIRYAGTANTPSLNNPTLHVSIITRTFLNYSGDPLVMKSSGMAGYTQGYDNSKFIRHSITNTKTTTGSTPVSILTLINPHIYKGVMNMTTAYPDLLVLSSEATKTVTFDVILNPNLIEDITDAQDLDSDASVTQYSILGSTVSGGEKLFSFVITGANSEIIPLSDLGLILHPYDRLVITASLSSGSNADVTSGLTWIERQ